MTIILVFVVSSNLYVDRKIFPSSARAFELRVPFVLGAMFKKARTDGFDFSVI
jgi:hypothetical protein